MTKKTQPPCYNNAPHIFRFIPAFSTKNETCARCGMVRHHETKRVIRDPFPQPTR